MLESDTYDYSLRTELLEVDKPVSRTDEKATKESIDMPDYPFA